MTPQSEMLTSLRTPEAVRDRCTELLRVGEAQGLPHFLVDSTRLDSVASLVVENIQLNYPSLNIPYHSRWRHFEVAGDNRWRRASELLGDDSPRQIARAKFDMAIVSVLLDAGAGPDWSYQDKQSGESYSRSEGLALASLELIETGSLSNRHGEPIRADAEALRGLSVERLESIFQVSASNPLAGVEGRLTLLHALGDVVLSRPDVFGSEEPRPGHLFDYLYERSTQGTIAAREILITILDALAPIWPGRLRLGEVNLGDVWRHGAIRRADATDGLIPLHKLSQWLTYSLLEPLNESGLVANGLDALTGLAEYRNGGLFIDTEVLTLRHREALDCEHEVGSELVVEWRALTVALLDQLAPLVRELLGLDDRQLPLARILQGGTWNTGRALAKERRAGGGPPLRIISDGTVF